MHGAITLDTAWVLTVLLLSLRLSAVLLLTPILGAANLPAIARILLVLSLAAALTGISPASRTAPLTTVGDTGALLRAGLTELALGATLALGVLLAFAAFSIAGQLLGVQIGFGLGQVIDPASNARSPILTSAYDQLALILFFLVNGHHALLRGIAFSLERFPLGQPWPVAAAFVPTLRLVTAVFVLGFALAAPVALLILLVDFALGIVGRQLPQLNMLTTGIPVKIVAGLLALSIWYGHMGGIVMRVYDAMFRTWSETFEAVSFRGLRGPLFSRPSDPSRGGSRA